MVLLLMVLLSIFSTFNKVLLLGNETVKPGDKIDLNVKNKDLAIVIDGKSRVVNFDGVLKRIPRVWIHNKKPGLQVSAKDEKPCLIPILLKELQLEHVIPIGCLFLIGFEI